VSVHGRYLSCNIMWKVKRIVGKEKYLVGN